MSKKYNIAEGAFIEKKNIIGRGPINKDNRGDYIIKLKNSKYQIQNLIDQINMLNENIENEIYFYIKYNGIIPKTQRIKFNKPKTIDDVRQIGSYLTKNGSFKIYYKISIKEMDELRQKFIYLLASSTDKALSFFIKIQKISEISFDKLEFPFDGELVVRYLPIQKIFDILIFEGKFINFNIDTHIATITKEVFEEINSRFPGFIYLIDELEIMSNPIELSDINPSIFDIKIPKNIECNQIIGIIDSGLILPAEFSDYILSSTDMRESKLTRDLSHGSKVASLIIANDELNPTAKDGLGNFKIRHFEVLSNQVSFFYLAKVLEKIIPNNQDIKVWNLSIGGIKYPYKRSISSMGIVLDKLSHKYDVIFIVASGNSRGKSGDENLSLNMPGDSLNSLTVGSVFYEDLDKYDRATYSSFGPILHYEKPEISHFGGPNNEDGSSLKLYYKGIVNDSGTSFSAPRVSRILSHLISKGYSVLQAKCKVLTMTRRETKKKKSSAFGWISNDVSSIDLLDEIILINNSPKYIPITLPIGVTNIKIASCHRAIPSSYLGEEYSYNNIEISLVWADSKEEEFERNKRKITITSEKYVDFMKEQKLRMDSGKYFTSKMKSYPIEKINNTITSDEAIGKIGIQPQLYMRVKKLSLFDLNDILKVGILITIQGNFKDDDFISENSNIINISLPTEIDISLN